MVRWFKQAIAKRDKRDEKQAMIDLREISTDWFKTSYVPPLGFQDCGLIMISRFAVKVGKKLFSVNMPN
jgi:hypothetical protein